MIYAILADIHSNLEALEIVLDDIAKKNNIDKIICLGDIVGYGANPNECCELIFKQKPICIIGNHDYATVNEHEANNYNSIAYKSTIWTSKQIDEKYKDIFKKLSHKKVINQDCVIVHGSLNDRNEYILNHYNARDCIKALNTLYPNIHICFYAHTHVKRIWRLSKKTKLCSNLFNHSKSHEYYINKDNYYLINPGSIGQARDRDNRASYIIFDSDKLIVSYETLTYDIAKTKEKIYKAGLPQYFGDRLFYGI